MPQPTKAVMVIGAACLAAIATTWWTFHLALFTTQRFIGLPYSQTRQIVMMILPILALFVAGLVRYRAWRATETDNSQGF